MIANTAAFVAAFAALANAQYAVVQQPQYNQSYVMPSLTPSASQTPHASAMPSLSANITGAPSAVIPPANQPSAGYMTYANSSMPPVTMGPKVVTSIITKTITSCPVTATKSSGETTTYFTDSTVTETQTITVCTKCVAKPTMPPSSGGENSPSGGEKAPAGGESSPEKPKKEKVTKTVTSTQGGSTVIITVTSTRTRTRTNTHTATAVPGSSGSNGESGSSPAQPGSGSGSSPAQEGSGSGSSPAQQGAKDGLGSNQVITATQKIYITKTKTVTAEPTCPAQVTVTVNQPDVTVTVTAGSSPEQTGKPSMPQEPHHYKNGNGTHNGTKCKSTGFITKPWPSATDLLASASASASMGY